MTAHGVTAGKKAKQSVRITRDEKKHGKIFVPFNFQAQILFLLHLKHW